MIPPPEKLEEGDSYLSKVHPSKRNGHLQCHLSEEGIAAQVQHISNHYPTALIIESSGNIYEKPAMEIMKAIYHGCTITQDEYEFLTDNLGYLFHYLVKIHTEQVKSEETLVHRRFSHEEVWNSTWDRYTDLCRDCEIAHLSPGSPNECRLVNGPLVHNRWLADRKDTSRYEAMVIGTHALLHLPLSLRGKILNMGLLADTEYTPPGISSAYFDSKAFKGDIQTRLDILGKYSTIPVLVEFQVTCQALQVPTQLYFAISTLARLQQGYGGPIILVIPSYFPVPDEGLDRYEEGKARQKYLVQLGETLGNMKGVAVCSLQIQSEAYDRYYHTYNPTWGGEPLFNKQGRQTREYMRRLSIAIMDLVGSLKDWCIPEAKRKEQVGHRPPKGDDVQE
jgi:hypothetical protein